MNLSNPLNLFILPASFCLGIQLGGERIHETLIPQEESQNSVSSERILPLKEFLRFSESSESSGTPSESPSKSFPFLCETDWECELEERALNYPNSLSGDPE